jgi:hypothetical protein
MTNLDELGRTANLSGPNEILDEFKEHCWTQEPCDMLAALHEAWAELAGRPRSDAPNVPFFGHTFGETTDVLAGDCLLEAWNVRETRAICDLMLRRHRIQPDLQEPIGLRSWDGETDGSAFQRGSVWCLLPLREGAEKLARAGSRWAQFWAQWTKTKPPCIVSPRGGLAQPGRALESHSRGRGFESLTLHHS